MKCKLGASLYLFLFLYIQLGITFKETAYYYPILIHNYKRPPHKNETFNVWMAIQPGIYPNIYSVDKPVNIGTPISILIYLNSPHNLDINVNECWAYNEQNYRISTMKVLLTNNIGFQQNKEFKLIDPWKSEYHAGYQNITTLLYTNTTAFTFPKKNYVYIACTVDICHESCTDSAVTTQSDGLLQIVTHKSTRFLVDLLVKPTTVSTTTISTTPSYNCVTQYPVCPTKFLTKLLRSITSTTSSSECSPESDIDPRCAVLTDSTTIISCKDDSYNYECTTDTSTVSDLLYNPFLPPNCYPNSKDPRCNVVEYDKPLYQYGISPRPPNCYPGSKDIRCKDLL